MGGNISPVLFLMMVLFLLKEKECGYWLSMVQETEVLSDPSDRALWCVTLLHGLSFSDSTIVLLFQNSAYIKQFLLILCCDPHDRQGTGNGV